MPTLHIQHSITDFDVWTAAFGRFAQVRHDAGVRAHRVRRPIDDDHYVVVDLEFDTAEEAAAILEFLRTKVWSSPAHSPALVGNANARVLETVEV